MTAAAFILAALVLLVVIAAAIDGALELWQRLKTRRTRAILGLEYTAHASRTWS